MNMIVKNTFRGALVVLFGSLAWTASVAAKPLIPTEPIAELKAPFPMPRLQRPAIPEAAFDIRDFGAKPGAGQDNTKTLRDAIAACAGQGGGSVVIPAGEWHTGPIHYRSNINLHLADGASLHFLPDAALYLPAVHVRYLGTECMNFSPMLYAYRCTNIALTGHGRIYGPGYNGTGKRGWCEWRDSRDKLAEAAGVKRAAPGDYTWMEGERLMESFSKQVPDITKRDAAATYCADPSLFQPMFCENVLVEDVMVARSGPLWSLHPTFCRNVIIRKVAIFTQFVGGTDAIDLDSCENALVEYCDVASGDDIVAIKSGTDDDGWRAASPTRNVVVRFVNGIHGNGYSIGSDIAGGAENIYFHDCIANASTPCRIKSRPGRGGVVRNATWERIRVGIQGGPHTGWNFPEIPAYEPAKDLIQVDTHYSVNRKQIDRTKITEVCDITFRDITATTVNTGIRVVNSKSFKNIVIENVAIENVLKGPGGVGQGVTVKNYSIAGKSVTLGQAGAGKQDELSQAAATGKIRVACIGDSTTQGAGATNRATGSYPAQLQSLLGDRFEVLNFGVGSCTLIRKGQPNVWSTLKRIEAQSVKPDLIVVSLGINDTCGGSRKCWDHKDDFSGDYRDLVDALRALPSKPRIWMCAPTPMEIETPGIGAERKRDLQERGPRLQELIGHIKEIAKEKNAGFIDLNTPLAGRPGLFTDGVHLNEDGYRAVAEIIATELKMKSP